MSDVSDEIFKIQSALADLISSQDVKNSYLATSTHEALLELHGNQLGLLKLAQDVLKLAMKSTPGSHINYDAASNLTECEYALQIGLSLADWEMN